MHDVIDWLGGYPYESITNKELDQLLTANGFTINKDLSFHGDKIPLGILCSGCCEYLAIRKN